MPLQISIITPHPPLWGTFSIGEGLFSIMNPLIRPAKLAIFSIGEGLNLPPLGEVVAQQPVGGNSALRIIITPHPPSKTRHILHRRSHELASPGGGGCAATGGGYSAFRISITPHPPLWGTFSIGEGLFNIPNYALRISLSTHPSSKTRHILHRRSHELASPGGGGCAATGGGYSALRISITPHPPSSPHLCAGGKFSSGGP